MLSVNSSFPILIIVILVEIKIRANRPTYFPKNDVVTLSDIMISKIVTEGPR